MRIASVGAKEILRWLAIAAFGGYGGYTLVTSILYVFRRPQPDFALFWFFILPFPLVYCGLFLAVAYFIFRKQYHSLCNLISAVAAVVVFGLVVDLPERLGFHDKLHQWTASHLPWAALIALPLFLAALIVPFFAARWTYRHAQRFLSALAKDKDDVRSLTERRP